MAVVSKGYGVGDTVFVYYKDSATLRFTPQSRVVRRVLVDSSGNNATVEFTNGESVVDIAANQRVFYDAVPATAQALCANKIIDDVLVDYDACAVLNSTTATTVLATAQPTLGIGRISQ